MKKILTLALALVMGATWSTTAQASGGIDLSGEIMIRGEAYDNTDYDADLSDTDQFTAQRTTLNIDASPVEGLIAHITLEANSEWGLTNAAAGVEVYESWIAIPNLFGSTVTGKFGRQQINLGAERIVGTDYEWQMHPRAFDAWAFVVPAGPFSITLADVKVVEGGSGTQDADLYVAYATAADLIAEGHNVDLYYMNLHAADADALGIPVAINSNADLATMGIRLNGAVAGIDYDIEYATQDGDIDEQASGTSIDIGGELLALEVGYSLPDTYNLRFYVGMDEGSGDDAKGEGAWIDMGIHSVDKHLGAFDIEDEYEDTSSMHYGVTADVSETCSLGLSFWTFEDTESTPGSIEREEMDLFVDHTFNDNLVGTIGYSTYEVDTAQSDTATFSYLQLVAHF